MERIAATGFVAGVVEAGADSAAQERDLTSGQQARTLPYVLRNDELWTLASRKIVAENHRARGAIGQELEHFDRISVVKVENLIGREAVHLGKGIGLEQIIDAGSGAAVGRIARGKRRMRNDFF